MEQKYDVEQFNSIIKHRRSIYPYQYEKSKAIPDKIIWQILENANRAPTHKQTEPWRFTVFCGEGLKHFGQLQSEIYKKFSGDTFNEGRYKKLNDYPYCTDNIIFVRKEVIKLISPNERHNNKKPSIRCVCSCKVCWSAKWQQLHKL